MILTLFWADVVDYFRNGSWHEERHQVEAIERHLLTEEQRKELFNRRLSIEKILRGRVYDLEDTVVANKLFTAWNEKLGFECYHTF